MNLPFFKKFNKKVLPSYFLVLILRDEKVQAVVFEELAGKAKIVGQKEEEFSTSIDEISQEELLDKLDKAISSAESSLPENIQTQKTIFGVKESWTDNDQIKKDHLTKLKKASEELGLIPIGFLVISQAVSHLLQKEEGVPVSAILVEVNKKSLTVTLLRAGKSIETKSSEIHDSIPFTVDTLLKHFNVPEILPSRIIIFNGKEDLSQIFISHTWSKSLPFLHLPQIHSLPSGYDAKSVLFGAATQMGFQVSENIPLTAKETKEQIQNFSVQEDLNASMTAAEEDFSEEPKLYKNLDASSFGFAKNVDVAKSKSQKPIIEEKPTSLVDKEIEVTETIPQFDTQEVQKKEQQPKDFSAILILIRNILLTVLGLIFTVFRKLNLKNISNFLPGKLGAITLVILLFIIALVSGYFLFLKATITISIDPKITEQNKSVLFSTVQKTDASKNILSSEFLSVSEEGSVSTPATGKKDVGTNAKGTVTIFNSLMQNKTLAKGTILESPNGLEFTLDQSITIKAVASHSADETVTPEKATVNVTADQLGKESNLPSGTKFSVGTYETSDLIAKNDNPFSGGTKKQVTVASLADSTKLEKDLIKQLELKAKEDLQKKLDQNKILLPTFITETLSNKSLSTKIGNEASNLSLTGTVEYQGLFYDKSDFISFSKSLLSKDIPSNQEIDYNNIQTSVLDIKQENDEEIKTDLKIRALLLPKIDQKKLIKDLKRKSFKDTEDILYKLPQVANVTIKLSPNIPFLPKNLPAREGNIKISIKIND